MIHVVIGFQVQVQVHVLYGNNVINDLQQTKSGFLYHLYISK